MFQAVIYIEDEDEDTAQAFVQDLQVAFQLADYSPEPGHQYVVTVKPYDGIPLREVPPKLTSEQAYYDRVAKELRKNAPPPCPFDLDFKSWVVGMLRTIAQ